tara:strand:+ start:3704 stop:4774 length:1071 start_codon:yes stop_codon:yes gene_type:complete
MSNEVISVDSESEQNSVGNITAEEFALQRLERLQGEQPEDTQEVQEEEVLEEAVESEEEVIQETEIESSEEETEDVLSQYNLDDLSEDELKDLAEKLGSRAVARFGELTAKRKAAEEELDRVKQSLQQDPLKQEMENVKDNPFDDVQDIKSLQEKAKEISDIIEWAEDVLFESDDYSAHDDVTELDGKKMTKVEVRSALKNARKSRDLYLPDQLKKVQKAENANTLKRELGAKALKELEWLNKEDDETRKAFFSIAANKDLQSVYKEYPVLGAELPYIIAHGVDNIYARKTVPSTSAKSGAKPKINPPKGSVPSSAMPEQGQRKSSKVLKDLSSRFKKSGNKDDFISLRTKQLSRK